MAVLNVFFVVQASMGDKWQYLHEKCGYCGATRLQHNVFADAASCSEGVSKTPHLIVVREMDMWVMDLA